MILELPRPFSVHWALAHVRTSSYGAPYRFVAEQRIRRVIRLDGRPVLLDFDFGKRPGCLTVAVLAGTAPGQAGGEKGACLLGPGLGRMAAWLFGLDDRLDDAYGRLRRDPVMAALVERYAGLRIIRAPDLYETLLVAVLGQQVSVASASAVRRRLMEALGDRVEFEGETYSSYPPPERLLAAGPDGLRALGCSRQKSRYLLEIAQRAMVGDLEQTALANLPDEQAVARLMKIPGVGRWTAEVGLMRGLGRPDAFPAADIGLMAAAQRVFHLPARPAERELRELAERWRGWRSYAAFYLWMTLMEGGHA